MGKQFKSPLPSKEEPSVRNILDKKAQSSQQFQRLGYQPNSVFQHPKQQSTTLFQGANQQRSNTFQSLGLQSALTFQDRQQQPKPILPTRVAQPANAFQNQGQQPLSVKSAKNIAAKQTITALGQEKVKQGQKHRRISTPAYIALACTICLLLLGGGGYWHYQANATTSLTTPTHGNYQQAIAKGNEAPASTSKGNQNNNGSINTLPSQVYSGPNTPFMNIPAQDGLIVISIAQQQLTVYDRGKVVYFSLVTTGQIAAFTPTGTFSVIGKTTNRYFGPPAGSNLQYAPEHINYAVQLTTGGIYIHDSAWRSVYGPGTNKPHNDPKFGEETGSHGCINTPYAVALWLYKSIAMGTTVQVVD